jgi:hypothetical protein
MLFTYMYRTRLRQWVVGSRGAVVLVLTWSGVDI